MWLSTEVLGTSFLITTKPVGNLLSTRIQLAVGCKEVIEVTVCTALATKGIVPSCNEQTAGYKQRFWTRCW